MAYPRAEIDRDRLTRLAAGGHSIRSAAAALGVSPATVRARSAEWRLAWPGFGGRLLVPRRELADLATGEATRAAAAAEFGVSEWVIKQRAKEYGVVFRRGGRIDLDKRVRLLNLVGAGHDTLAGLTRASGLSKQAVHRLVGRLAALGLLAKNGSGRAARVRLTGWKNRGRATA